MQWPATRPNRLLHSNWEPVKLLVWLFLGSWVGPTGLFLNSLLSLSLSSLQHSHCRAVLQSCAMLSSLLKSNTWLLCGWCPTSPTTFINITATACHLPTPTTHSKPAATFLSHSIPKLLVGLLVATVITAASAMTLWGTYFMLWCFDAQ